MDKSKKAKEYMAERKSNCAQSVFRVFSEDLGMDENVALSMAQGFGGGMHINGVCGVVTGAFMALGMAYPASTENPRQAMDKVNALQAEFNRKFQELHGSLTCTGLLGHDLSTKEGMASAREKGVFISQCPVFVSDAVKIVEELLKKN